MPDTNTTHRTVSLLNQHLRLAVEANRASSSKSLISNSRGARGKSLGFGTAVNLSNRRGIAEKPPSDELAEVQNRHA